MGSSVPSALMSSSRSAVVKHIEAMQLRIGTWLRDSVFEDLGSLMFTFIYFPILEAPTLNEIKTIISSFGASFMSPGSNEIYKRLDSIMSIQS